MKEINPKFDLESVNRIIEFEKRKRKESLPYPTKSPIRQNKKDIKIR